MIETVAVMRASRAETLGRKASARAMSKAEALLLKLKLERRYLKTLGPTNETSVKVIG